MFTVYIIQSVKTHGYYVGCSSNLYQRIEKHNHGANKFTRNKSPWILVYKEILPTKHLALIRERQIKNYKGGRAFKKLLLNYGEVA